MSGCGRWEEPDPPTAAEAARQEQFRKDKETKEFNERKLMNAERESFHAIPKQPLDQLETDALLAKALREDCIASSEAIKLLQSLYLERFGGQFLQERLPKGSRIVVSGGWDDFEYEVIEHYFDGSLLVQYVHANGKPKIINSYKSIIRRGPEAPAAKANSY